ncbi:hypothetical protein ASZ78_001295 [Callipepla squamata]|uniref:Uncharacterized protein n=1 Tax=Callipepla squamata TaxID=9009 RepID=A0A226MFJ6_CALSU|nr:hypothetical protein ASZ78_001295 [Callipepla squamata]
MAAVAARPAAVFGCRPGVPGGVCFLQERLVLHAAGAACAQFHTEHRRHEFIPGRENSRGVRALAVSRSRRYLAVSETAAEEPALTVYELTEGPPRRRRTLTAAELPAREAVSLAFSPDGRHLAAATGPPEVHLALWLWEKRRLLAAVRVEDAGSGVCQVSFSPRDNARVCMTGNGFFKLFKYSKGALKQVNLQKGEPQNYLCHAWLSEEEIICGTATGKLLLFESGELLWQTDVEYRKSPKKLDEGARTKDYASCFDVPCEPTSEDGDSLQDSLPQISAVASYSKGFACSSSPGVVLLFEKTNKKEVYEESKEIWEESSYFEYLHFPLHSASITGLDICIRKPIVATCSLDKSVRVWNYKTK